MRIASFIVPLLLICCSQVSGYPDSDRVRIDGLAPGHSGDELVFYRWSDQISFTEILLGNSIIGSNDEFSLEIDLTDGPLYIYAYTGIYYLYMYVEPGQYYQVILPEKSEKSEWEKMNPYFEGIPTHIAVLNHDSTELNNLIRGFDLIYEPLFGEPLVRLTIGKDHLLLDSIINVFNVLFSDAGHSYFNTYRVYKIGLLKIMSQMQTARSVSDSYFRDEPVYYDNQAYMELFNQVYNRYFLFFSRTLRGSRIFDDISKHRSLAKLKNTLMTDTVLGDERLLEMVILKGLHDAFYGSDFSRSGLLVVLDSLAETTIYPEHGLIARNIRDKVTKLMPGFSPPDFSLMDRDGNMISLSDFKGDYVYLNFCTAVSYSCLSEYDVLNGLKEKHAGYLKIVTVFIVESYSAMLEFLSKNDYDWDFLYYGNQPTVLKDYSVRMFPGYYLIDRDGTMLMSPAPSPAENFEMYLFRTMRSRGELR